MLGTSPPATRVRRTVAKSLVPSIWTLIPVFLVKAAAIVSNFVWSVPLQSVRTVRSAGFDGAGDPAASDGEAAGAWLAGGAVGWAVAEAGTAVAGVEQPATTIPATTTASSVDVRAA